MRCAIWYHLYNLKNVKNTHGGVLILAKSQASACNFTKINTPQWAFFTFFKFKKWYEIALRTTVLDILHVKENKDQIFYILAYITSGQYRLNIEMHILNSRTQSNYEKNPDHIKLHIRASFPLYKSLK